MLSVAAPQLRSIRVAETVLVVNIPVLREYVVSRPVSFVMNALQSLFQTQIFHGFAS